MFISSILHKKATDDIMSLTYQFITHLERKFTVPKLLYSRKNKINTAGPCAKLEVQLCASYLSRFRDVEIS
jgi:hypothetical protein